jgi:hypothetical protein
VCALYISARQLFVRKLIPAPCPSLILHRILFTRVAVARRAESEGRRQYPASGEVIATTQAGRQQPAGGAIPWCRGADECAVRCENAGEDAARLPQIKSNGGRMASSTRTASHHPERIALPVRLCWWVRLVDVIAPSGLPPSSRTTRQARRSGVFLHIETCKDPGSARTSRYACPGTRAGVRGCAECNAG